MVLLPHLSEEGQGVQAFAGGTPLISFSNQAATSLIQKSREL